MWRFIFIEHVFNLRSSFALLGNSKLNFVLSCTLGISLLQGVESENRGLNPGSTMYYQAALWQGTLCASVSSVLK